MLIAYLTPVKGTPSRNFAFRRFSLISLRFKDHLGMAPPAGVEGLTKSPLFPASVPRL